MTTWRPDTCGCYPPCEIRLDENGEPAEHLFVCAEHSKHKMDHVEVAAECRAKEALRAQYAETEGVAHDEVEWKIDLTTREVSAFTTDENGKELAILKSGKVQ